MMESASPTATASTNRGGRPKDWTEPRTRRLIRLYVYTNLPFPKILGLLEEDEFKPGKDAANKVKNSVLGNDPRWLRPKDDEEEGHRIRGLRNSLRGRQGRHNTASAFQDTNGAAGERYNTAIGTFPENGSLGGTTITHSYRSSTEDFRHFQDPTSFAYPGTSNANIYTANPDDTLSRFVPSLIGRRDTSRQDTGLTTSTDISITSVLREKLSFLSLSKAKRTVKVLKRYTFPKNAESQRAPNDPPSLFQGPDVHSPADRFNATYALPGDILNADLFVPQQQCATQSEAHAAGVCWCKLADHVSPMRSEWDNLPWPRHINDPSLIRKDMFGNTIFHYLATLDGREEFFVHLVCQALRKPELPIRDSNTGGQTFLHVLHRSWFQEGSRLDELLDTLRRDNFDVFATDLYGRSIFHILRDNRRSSARFSGSDIQRLNRRDAFGRKPMDTRPPPDGDYSASHNQTTQRTNATATDVFGRPVPRINTQTDTVEIKALSTHADLLRIVNSATGANGQSAPNPHQEDPQGRNGFHCLAEVDFCLSPSTPRPGSRGHLRDDPKANPQSHKRKLNHDKEIEVPRTTPDSQRLQCIQNLIDTGVDANQYDKLGNTPLMSFVVNSSDATKYDKEESESVIKALVHNAGAKLESRNRDGETALHLAARHGKTIALPCLA
ncbi:hypothetical protein NUW58_g3847 [Xylaria curta]|uniref:Uncharacterized protein n=1 Tax=Xylaria curta TaxID=42375 RepID=A0ACC1P914_9PEZI|nr:hypothetical protein NUW58_g3847 [Xylaria curta]